ncbi:uncharacterized protein TNCV_1385581 [Trichonephila clavipes]|nr:uncharacterized protein TNCV_1385581 [Trichonephila clavipes]
MLIFFDSQGVIHKEFLPEGRTMDAASTKVCKELEAVCLRLAVVWVRRYLRRLSARPPKRGGAGGINRLRWAAGVGRDRRTGFFPSLYRPLRWSGINGVAARAVGFKDLSVTLRSTNGEAATEKGVELSLSSTYHASSGLSFVAAVAEWYRYRMVACLVTSSSPVPLKTRRVGQRCTLNLSRAETSSRWCGVVVRRGGSQLRCRPRHLTMVQNDVVRRQKALV